MSEKEQIHRGHRQRMKSKFLCHGARIFDTYELLEMLLYYTVPYKDTNPIAKQLLEDFGSLDGVLRATAEELSGVSGVGSRTGEFISRVGKLTEDVFDDCRENPVPLLDSYDAMGRFLLKYFEDIEESAVVLVLLDNSMRLISVEKMYDCDYGSGGVMSKPFIDTALKRGASVAVVGHSHPCGPLFPSRSDMVTGEMLYRELGSVGVLLAENYIIAGGEFLGIKTDLTGRLSQMPALENFAKSRRVVGRAEDESTSGKEVTGIKNLAAALSHFLRGDGEAERVAERLSADFYTLPMLFLADGGTVADVCKVTPNVVQFIRLAGAIASRRVTDGFRMGEKHTDGEIEKYLTGLFLDKTVESLYLIVLDKNGRVMSVEYVAEGTINQTGIPPRRIVECAIRKCAHTVYLAHNHPRGSVEPSGDDIAMTAKLREMFTSSNIRFERHYIISADECSVMRFDKSGELVGV